jgi:CAAX protease family protein
MNTGERTNTLTVLRKQLHKNKLAKLAELVLFFAIPLAFIKGFTPLAKDNLILTQAVIWIANVIMLAMVWIGLWLRGEDWNDLGLSFKYQGFKKGLRVFLLSLFVFVLAVAGFVIGSIILANITGIPEGADMSRYDYLKDNPGMLLLTMAGVLFVSSFGEEVIYRGFLITRMSEFGLGTRRWTIIAVIISSIVFGLVHYAWGIVGIVQTGFMGLALGLCYILMKRRLVIMIMAHAYMDTILVFQMYSNAN